MFQASRQLFHRSQTSTSTTGDVDVPSDAEDAPRGIDRHPAMRGIKVSPVHGRHCICQRCEQHKNAA